MWLNTLHFIQKVVAIKLGRNYAFLQLLGVILEWKTAAKCKFNFHPKCYFFKSESFSVILGHYHIHECCTILYDIVSKQVRIYTVYEFHKDPQIYILLNNVDCKLSYLFQFSWTIKLKNKEVILQSSRILF